MAMERLGKNEFKIITINSFKSIYVQSITLESRDIKGKS